MSDIDDNFDSELKPCKDFVSLKNFSPQLVPKFIVINEDLNLFGHFRVVEYRNNDLCLDLNNIADGVEQLLKMYKDKVKMLSDCDDKIRFSDSEISRFKKLLSRKTQEYEAIATDCARLRDSMNDIRNELRLCNKQLSCEKNNVKVLNSNITRERNQTKNDKTKIEREMVVIKERMNKLLTDPKKLYPSIEINAAELPVSSLKAGQKRVIMDEKYENQVNEELISSYRRHLEDVILENRQLREQLIGHLMKLKQVTQNHGEQLTNDLGSQRNNNGLSRASSDSNISVKSNETFIVSKPKTDIDERIYLEMPFDVIKDDLLTIFEETYGYIDRILKDRPLYESKTSMLDIMTKVDLLDSSSSENIARLQKEIFQMRRQLIDYESIIQGKDSLLEVAIEQRIRRGSLLPLDNTTPVKSSKSLHSRK